MLIPGAIFMGIGAFTFIVSVIVRINSGSKSKSHSSSKTRDNSDNWLAEVIKQSKIIESQSLNLELLSDHERLSERMKFPNKEKIEDDIKMNRPLQKWYLNLLLDPGISKMIAIYLGLEIGNSDYDFEGDWRTKGFYAYKSGKYAGQAYFGLEGTTAESLEPIDDDEEYRPWDLNNPNVPSDIRKRFQKLEPALARNNYLEIPVFYLEE